MSPCLLLIFIKNPVAGKVKTRLAKSIGTERALGVYLQLLHHTLEITKALALDKKVYYSDWIEEKDNWAKAGYEQGLQSGTDLGQRMSEAFERAFEDGYKKVVIIGSDCWELTPSILTEAFDSLNLKQVVVGPARDGGYYLLGMKHYYPELFLNKSWSTSSVFSETVADLRKRNLSYHLLPVLSDVDEEKDLPPFE